MNKISTMLRYRGWISFLFAALILFLGVSSVQGYPNDFALPRQNGNPPPISEPEKINVRVGGDQNYPPYEYLQDGKPVGFNVDLIRAVAREMGFQIEFDFGPWTEVREKVITGELDMLLGMAQSDERNQQYDFSVPHTYLTFDLFVPASSSIQSIEDIKDKSIVVQQGGVMQDYLNQQNLTTHIILVQNVADALQLIDDEKYDGALINKVQGQYLISNLDLTNIRRVGVNLPAWKYSFAVAQGNENLLSVLNEGLYILNQTGEFDQIHEKWFGVYEEPDNQSQVRIAIIVTSIILLIFVGFLILINSLRNLARKRQEALKKREEDYRLLVDNATEGVVVSCGEYFVFANPRATEILGYTNAELHQIKIAEMIHPEDRDMVIDRYRRRLSGEDVIDQYSIRVFTRAGDVRWIDLHAVRIIWEGQPATLDMFSDSTERRRAEDQIQRQLQHMAALRAVDMAITASMDLPLTLRVLLEQVIAQLGVDAASVLLLNAKAQELAYATGQGFRTSLIKTVRVRLGQTYAGRAAIERKPIFVPNLEFDPDDDWRQEHFKSESFIAYIAVPLISKGVVKGVLEIFNRAPLRAEPEWMRFLEALADQAAIAIDNATLFEDLQKANMELKLAYEATIEGWARALELRDGETEGHSKRVSELTVALARAMGIREEGLMHIRRGALLHDIGKMGIPDSILLKQDQLTDAEWEIMRRHPEYAREMLFAIDFLRPAIDIPYAHHESWDGRGYPNGLKGEQIPLAARIFAVVDVWDALSYDRPYRKGWPQDRVIEHIRSLSGKKFDPRVVTVFLEEIVAKEPHLLVVDQDIQD